MAATTTARSRGIGLTSKDMEASRLVFVFVRDSKPRRKIAVPVPDSYSWDQFLTQVKAKLKLTGISDIYLSSSGHRVRTVSELQDIDELCVVEGPPDGAGTPNGIPPALSPGRQGSTSTSEIAPQADGAPVRQQAQPSVLDRHRSVIVSGAAATASTSARLDEDSDQKYVRRSNPLRRSLQRLLPSLFAPGLPITVKDTQADVGESSSLKARRRRGKRSLLTPQNLVLALITLACVAIMLFMFSKVMQVQQQVGQAAEKAVPEAKEQAQV